METDRLRLDTLQQTLSLLQGRYEQVQKMLSVPAPSTTNGSSVAQRPQPSDSKKKGN